MLDIKDMVMYLSSVL